MFTIYNTFIANLLMEDKIIMNLVTASIWLLNITVIVYTSFIFEEMTSTCIISIVIAGVYLIVLVPSFMYITTYINSEHQEEAALAFIEKRNYKQMFDAIQEGIVVLQGDHITLMNELSNKLMSANSKM